MKRTRIMTITAMLSAFAFVLQVLGSVMGLKVGGFLEIEFSDLPAIIGTLSLGPLCGVLVELIKNLLHCMLSSTGYVGELANFCVNGVYVLVLGLVYKRMKTKKGAVIGFSFATVIYSLVAAFVNYFVMLPFYSKLFEMHLTKEAMMSMVLTLITPFNIAKGTLLAVITLLIYKKLSPIIKGTAR